MKIKKEDFLVFYDGKYQLPEMFETDIPFISRVLAYDKKKMKTILPAQTLVDVVKTNYDKLKGLINEMPMGNYCVLLANGRQVFIECVVEDGEKYIACVECQNDVVITIGYGDGRYKALNKQDVSIYTALAYLLFYFFAEVETVILNKQQKRAKAFDCKYVSDFDQDIILLNSTWYQNLIKSEGFKVRGHFALRAFGEGRTQRRLVWISEYDKNGYVRKAGIEK